ncbi:twitchin-like [Leptopilina boulardi]|uniref:twitchin-like n=1 Tax=Leptopilina boulardi TaxID=63433 RepID=UPI0021F67ACD|nr:twitchin-like [Leptopilina boulardi]
MKFIIFIFLAKFVSTSISTDEIIKVLDVSEETVNLQWYNKKSGTCIYLIHDLTNNKSIHEYSKDVNKGNLTNRITTLRPGNTYKFEFVCFNAKGTFNRYLSNEIKTYYPQGKPNPPEGPLTITNVTNKSATLNWFKPKNSTNYVRYHIILYTLNSKEETLLLYYASENKSLKFTINKLNPSTKYKFEIMSFNSMYNSDRLMSKQFTTLSW